jgi:putative transposase
MIDPNHSWLSIVRQCELVSVASSSFYYTGKGDTPFNLKLMRLIDEQYMATLFYGLSSARWPVICAGRGTVARTGLSD